MQITVNLQDMKSYSPIVLLVAGIVFIMLIGMAVVFCVIKFNKKTVYIDREISVEDREKIKKKYIAYLNGLEERSKAGKVSNRRAYQELSKIIRNYTYETTGVKVHNYTLDEIKSTNMSGVYNVVSECYAPEFSIDKNGNIYVSIDKARKVVEGWN